MSSVLIAEYLFQEETSVAQALIDNSTNYFQAAEFGSGAAFAQPYTNEGPGLGGYARQFPAASSGYSASFSPNTYNGATTDLLLEVIVKQASAAPSAKLDLVALVDSGGHEVLTVSIDTDGTVSATGYIGGVSVGTATGTLPVFPTKNWVHLAARWTHSTHLLEILVSQTATDVLGPPGYPVGEGSTIGGHTTASGAIGTVTGVKIHPGTVAVDAIGFVQVSEPLVDPQFNLVGTNMLVSPKGSAGCTVILDLKPAALVEPDGTPLGFGATDALNPSNWTVIASDGSATRVAEVIPSTSPGAVDGYWFDVTFEEPLDVGQSYTLWQENLTTLGNLVSAGIADGTPLQSTFAIFDALTYAAEPVKTFEQQMYGGYDIANPMGNYTMAQNGDLANDSGTTGLVKRCIRRIITPTNGFKALKGYGVGLLGKVKKLASVSNIRKLYSDTKTQLLQEPGVSSLDLTLDQLPTGQCRVRATLHTIAGDQSLDYTTPKL